MENEGEGRDGDRERRNEGTPCSKERGPLLVE